MASAEGSPRSSTTNEPPEPADDTHPAVNTATKDTHTTRRADRRIDTRSDRNLNNPHQPWDTTRPPAMQMV
ncbi:MAG: hypothetical protein OXH28_14055 [bacterium]|nr:hypothetical protein [bacterium]MXV89963.1 hypothetical protein [Acidimicrobiia bacterium]MYC45519.1 hypothetical protein [Acidimicrobiia bacterium]